MALVFTTNGLACVRRLLAQKVPYWTLTDMGAKPTNALLTKTGPLSTSADAMEVDNNVRRAVKPFSEIPSARSLPLVGTLLQFPRDPNKITDFLEDRCKNYFPIYRENLGIVKMVVFYDIDEIEKMFRSEPKYPRRIDLIYWQHYRKLTGEADGVLTSNDESWHKMRTVIDKPMLRIKDVSGYADDVNEVMSDFLVRLEKIREPDGLVPNLEKELFQWALESVCKILYEKRFGALSDNLSPEMREFFAGARDVLDTTIPLMTYPIWFSRIFFPRIYRKHMAAWKTIFAVGKKCVDEKMDELLSNEDEDHQDKNMGVVSYLLKEQSLSVKEIYSNIIELMGAGGDTTSTAVLWLLEELALNPDVQEKLLEEVENVIPDGQPPTFKDLQNMPYLKAVLKESLRKHPVTVGLIRILQEDTEICGYNVPAKTIVTTYAHIMGRLPQYFEDPDAFRPERWLRGSDERVRPYLNMAFGFGTRMCVGRRIAELEMHVLLARLVQKFSIEPGFSERAGITMAMTLKPDRPMKIKLIERKHK